MVNRAMEVLKTEVQRIDSILPPSYKEYTDTDKLNYHGKQDCLKTIEIIKTNNLSHP